MSASSGGRPARSPFAKYMMLEAPGWALAAVVLGFLSWSDYLSLPLAALLLALWIGKDFALWPILRIGYEDSHAGGTEGLVGALGTVRERLDPEGYVRVGSELWRAVVSSELAPVEPGTAVRVIEVRELTLRVEPA